MQHYPKVRHFPLFLLFSPFWERGSHYSTNHTVVLNGIWILSLVEYKKSYLIVNICKYHKSSSNQVYIGWWHEHKLVPKPDHLRCAPCPAVAVYAHLVSEKQRMAFCFHQCT